MKPNKLQRMSSLIEWILLFTMLATPLITVTEAWSQLLGDSDYLHQKLVNALALDGNTALNLKEPPLERSPVLSASDYPLDTGTRLLATLVMLLPDVVFMLILWQLRQLFRGYRHGLLFTFEQIHRYRQIGGLLCISFLLELLQTPLLDTVLTMSGPEIHGSISISSSDFRLLLAGLIVLALALVMREAKQLADEQQLTV